jgi:phage recombination protein Bet
MSNTPAAGHKENLPAIAPPRIPYHPAIGERFGIDRSEWKVLVESIFPSAKTIEGVALALAYCKARKIDIFKRVVHIVPIWNSRLGREVETVWPGIAELRTTAHRTGQYAGKAATVFGPVITKEFAGSVGSRDNIRHVSTRVTFPEWAQVTVYRIVQGVRCEFVGPKVFWLETYATQGKSDIPNEMWQTRPFGQLDKCAEAAALRVAYPEEIGNEYIDEEVQHRKAVENLASPVANSPGGTSSLAAKITQMAGEKVDLPDDVFVEQIEAARRKAAEHDSIPPDDEGGVGNEIPSQHDQASPTNAAAERENDHGEAGSASDSMDDIADQISVPESLLMTTQPPVGTVDRSGGKTRARTRS